MPRAEPTSAGAPLRSVETGAVSLRPIDVGDIEWLDGWLASAAAAVGYDAIDAERPAASLCARLSEERAMRARLIERGGVASGVVLYRLHAPRCRAATFELLATPPSLARHGTGMRAAVLAEGEMRAAGARVVYAPAPAIHGIDVYFWIRLGYRPLLRENWPCDRDGVAWLMRELS